MKHTDTHHITFHIQKAAVFLSVPGSTTIASLREQLVPALARLRHGPEGPLPCPPPATADDIQIWEDKEGVEGAEGPAGIRLCPEGSIKSLGWPGWKRVYLSIADESGNFPEPSYTVPSPMDGDEE